MGTLVRLAVVLAIALASSDARAAICTAVTGTWTAIGTGTALSGSADPDCAAVTAADTLNIPSGVTVTITAGSSVTFSGGAGGPDIDAGGTLVIASDASAGTPRVGVLTIANDMTVEGQLTVGGYLRTCVTDSPTCVLAGQTAENVEALDTWTTYAIGAAPTALYTITNDGTWDIDDAEILYFGADIDGDPTNQSPAGRLRPFFDVDSQSGSNVVVTNLTGSSTTVKGRASHFSELFGQTTGTACAFPDVAGDGTVDDGTWEAADAATDGSELDDTVLDRGHVGSIPANSIPFCQAGVAAGGCADALNLQTEAASTLWTGTTLMLDASATATPPYMIVDSDEQTADRVWIYPSLNTLDWTGAAQNCNVSWGFGTGSDDAINGALGPREFISFVPAQIVATGQDVVITIDGASAGFDSEFALLGPFEGAAGYGPRIHYDPTTTSTDTHEYVWSVNQSSDGGGALECGEAAWELWSDGSITLSNVQVSHDREDQDCSGSSDTTPTNLVSGLHAIHVDGSDDQIVSLENVWVFNFGDDAMYETNSNYPGNPTGGTFSWVGGGAGWIIADSTNVVDINVRTTASYNIENLFVANVTARTGMCDAGTDGATSTIGSWCNADANCGTGGSCKPCDDPNFNRVGMSSGEPLTLRNIFVIAPDGESPIFNGSAGYNILSVDGAWVWDTRTNNTGSDMTGIPAMTNAVWSMKNVSAPWAVFPLDLEYEARSNFFGHVRHRDPSSARGIVRLQGGANQHVVSNNVFLDITSDTTQDFIDFEAANTAGSTLDLTYNVIDRATVGASTDDMVDAWALDEVSGTEPVATVTGNIAGGYRHLIDCSTGVNTSQIVGANMFAVASGVAAATTGATVDTACFVTANEANAVKASTLHTSRLFALMFGNSFLSGGDKFGPRAQAGYRQSAAANRFEIDVLGIGSATGGITRPCNTRPGGC